METSLFSILEAPATKWPGDTAVIHGSRSFSYQELYWAADALAVELRAAGVEAGDKVGVMCPRGAEYIIAFFAVIRAGAIVVTISPALKTPEILNLANEMELDAFCYSPQFTLLVPEGSVKSLREAHIRAAGTRLVVKLASSRTTPESRRSQLLKINAASIGFSSGTTAKSKGIIYSHATLLERANARREIPAITKDTSMLWLRAMDRFMPSQIFRSLLAGAKVILADSASLEPVLRLIREHGVDQVYAVPLFYQMLNHQCSTKDELGTVRYFVSGGASLPNAAADAFRANFGREIVQFYGLTECSPVLANANEDADKRGSVGRPVPGREVKLAASGAESFDHGAVGELLVRGPGMFDAYYKPWQLREQVLENGWFRTGDLARRDPDGYYWIVGRTKDVINVGGVKVFPCEIEERLLNHPAVEEAVVYRVPESRFGEVPRAKVKLHTGIPCAEKELLRYANERLSVFKALRGIEFVDEIPKTISGKTKRRT